MKKRSPPAHGGVKSFKLRRVKFQSLMRLTTLHAIAWLVTAPCHAQVERIWLTHQSTDPSHLVVNWETAKPTSSVVNYGRSAKLDRVATAAGLATRHHVEIAIPEQDGAWHYSVGTGADASPPATFKGYPTRELRVGIVGDWGFAKGKDLGALRNDDVHLLLTAGDNVPSLH